MNILGTILVGLAIVLGTRIRNYLKLKMAAKLQAEKVLVNFIEFNREVSRQLMALEEQGRHCYQSLDGNCMKILFEAQRALQHGRSLEQLGIDALTVGKISLAEELTELFSFDGEYNDNEFDVIRSINNIQPIKDLTPRAYRCYAIALIQEVNKAVSLGICNLDKLDYGSANAAQA